MPAATPAATPARRCCRCGRRARRGTRGRGPSRRAPGSRRRSPGRGESAPRSRARGDRADPGALPSSQRRPPISPGDCPRVRPAERALDGSGRTPPAIVPAGRQRQLHRPAAAVERQRERRRALRRAGRAAERGGDGAPPAAPAFSLDRRFARAPVAPRPDRRAGGQPLEPGAADPGLGQPAHAAVVEHLARRRRRAAVADRRHERARLALVARDVDPAAAERPLRGGAQLVPRADPAPAHRRARDGAAPPSARPRRCARPSGEPCRRTSPRAARSGRGRRERRARLIAKWCRSRVLATVQGFERGSAHGPPPTTHSAWRICPLTALTMPAAPTGATPSARPNTIASTATSAT